MYDVANGVKIEWKPTDRRFRSVQLFSTGFVGLSISFFWPNVLIHWIWFFQQSIWDFNGIDAHRLNSLFTTSIYRICFFLMHDSIAPTIKKTTVIQSNQMLFYLNNTYIIFGLKIKWTVRNAHLVLNQLLKPQSDVYRCMKVEQFILNFTRNSKCRNAQKCTKKERKKETSH